jgi:hypothetical protein
MYSTNGISRKNSYFVAKETFGHEICQHCKAVSNRSTSREGFQTLVSIDAKLSTMA